MEWWPFLEEGSIEATAVASLSKAKRRPDVVVTGTSGKCSEDRGIARMMEHTF
jgi:uncharacterized protein (DUF169 family)